MKRRTWWALLLGVSVAVVALAEVPSSGPAAVDESEEREEAELAQGDTWSGLLVPLNATDLYAPESGFRVSGWSSWGGPLKLMELAPDGKQVKKGDVIARFEFNAADAQRWINERIQRAHADRSQARIQGEQTLESLRVDQRRLTLEAERAGYDVQKERAVSKRQASLYRIAHQLAQFETDAIAQRLASAQRSYDAEMAYHEEAVKRAEQDLARFAFYEQRYKMVAPHDGVVRHAYNARERRKFQKGDSVSPGQLLVSVAKDPALAARFFVPEHRLRDLREGSEVVVVSASSGEELRATVKRIDFFPQELGFLMELPNLPHAREKAFAVLAEFQSTPDSLSAGTELRVKGVRR